MISRKRRSNLMTPARAELHRLLQSVADDLQRDGYAAEQIASVMIVLGLKQLFGEDRGNALKLLDAAREVIRKQEDEWLQ
jgi:hypothetical protein